MQDQPRSCCIVPLSYKISLISLNILKSLSKYEFTYKYDPENTFKSIRKQSWAHEALILQIMFVVSTSPTHVCDCPSWQVMPNSIGTDSDFFWFLGCAINVWKLQLQKEMLSVLWPREHTVKMLCPVPLAPGQHSSALSCQKQEVRKANSYLTEKTRTKAGCFFSPLHTVVTATKHHISNLDLTYLFVAQGWFLSFHSCCWTSDIPHTYVTWTPILIKDLPNAIYTQNLWFRHESGNITQRTYASCYSIL